MSFIEGMLLNQHMSFFANIGTGQVVMLNDLKNLVFLARFRILYFTMADEKRFFAIGS